MEKEMSKDPPPVSPVAQQNGQVESLQPSEHGVASQVAPAPGQVESLQPSEHSVASQAAPAPGQVESSQPSEHVRDGVSQVAPAPVNNGQQVAVTGNFGRINELLEDYRQTQAQARNDQRGNREGLGYGKEKAQENLQGTTSQFWAKQGAPNTKRLQDSIDQETKEETQRSEFLYPPRHKGLAATGRYVWFDTDIPPTKLLGERLRMLDDVRVEFKVYIDYEDSTGCIRIRSQNQQKIEAAITGIKVKIQHARADAARFAPVFIIEPPPAVMMKANVKPLFNTGPDGKKLPTVVKLVLYGASLSAENLAAWEIKRDFITQENLNRFKEHIKKSLVSFRALKSGMRMRAHLGHVQLVFYRKDFATSTYSFEKFSQMFSHGRTHVKFQKELGDVAFAFEVLKFFGDVNGVFDPADSQTDSLAETKPKHSLIVVAHRPSSRDQFRVESDIHMLKDNTKRPYQKFTGLKLMTENTKYYVSDSNKTRFTFGSIGFESNFDWSIDMMTNEPVSPPPVFQGLIMGCMSCAVVQNDINFLNYPSIALRPTAALKVDSAWIKSTLEYKLRGSPYTIEVSIYRQVEGRLPDKVHVTKCGIRFYNKDWDLVMTPDKDVTQQRDWSEETFFPSTPGSTDGLADFVAKIRAVQTCLDCIAGAIA